MLASQTGGERVYRRLWISPVDDFLSSMVGGQSDESTRLAKTLSLLLDLMDD